MNFVIGFPRSGTTLLATMLGRHSKIAVPPETRFYEEIAKGKPTADALVLRERVRNSNRLKDLGAEFVESLDVFSQVGEITVDSILSDIAARYLKLTNKCVFVEKSPVHGLHLREIERLNGDSFKCAYLIRDPRDCYSSLKKVPWSHRSPIRHCAEWKFRFRLAWPYMAAADHRFIFVKYEDLLRDPEKQLAAICNHFGVEFESRMLKPYGGDKAPTYGAWEAGWKSNVDKPIMEGNASKWRLELSEMEKTIFASGLGEELGILGYEFNENRVSRPLKLFIDCLSSRAYVNIRRVLKNEPRIEY